MTNPQLGPESGLDAGLERLVAAGTLTAAQADAVRRELASHQRPDESSGAALTVEGTASAAPVGQRDTSLTGILSEVGGYVGAAFVFAAGIAITGPNWDRLSEAAQVAVLIGPALLMLVAALGVAVSAPGRWTPRERTDHGGLRARRRLISTLVVVAAALSAAAGSVLADGSAEPAITSLTALGVSAAGYVACRTVLLHLSSAVAALSAVYTVHDWVRDYSPDSVVPGLLVTALGAAWAAAAFAGALSERILGLVTGAVIGFVGGETIATMTTENDAGTALGYLVMGLVALGGLAGYVAIREVALLAAGTLALAILVPQAVIDYSDGALGTAGALLVCGLSIVAASVLGLRLHRAADEPTPAHS